MHDKMICDIKELKFSKKVRLWLDSSFEGFNPENAEINRPKNKPKGKELTDIEKNQINKFPELMSKSNMQLAIAKYFVLSKKKSDHI